MKKLTFFILLMYCSSTVSSQEIFRDTLYFNFDESYILKTKATGADYRLLDSNKDGICYFEITQSIQNLNPKKILCLKDYIRTSEYFRKGWKRELMDFSLCGHFSNFILILVKKKENGTEYIQVQPVYIVE